MHTLVVTDFNCSSLENKMHTINVWFSVHLYQSCTALSLEIRSEDWSYDCVHVKVDAEKYSILARMLFTLNILKIVLNSNCTITKILW